MSTTHHRVFVYGTLMQGEHHHDEMKGAHFLGLTETQPEYELVQLDYYPAIVRGGSLRIIGELYDVDDAILARLDKLEEVPLYYVRERITLADGSQADTYVLPRERLGGAALPIPSGYF